MPSSFTSEHVTQDQTAAAGQKGQNLDRRLPEPSGKWGDPSAQLTPEEHERALARFRHLRGQGGVRFGFVPMLDYTFEARTPEELDAAVRRRLLEETRGQLPN